jgi:hypothetical protein
VIVQLHAGSVSIEEPDDCRRLHVATDLPPADVDAALRFAGIGRLAETGDALLDVAELHSRARAVATAESWDADWTAMIGYATTKGWVGDDGRTVTAHVESA